MTLPKKIELLELIFGFDVGGSEMLAMSLAKSFSDRGMSVGICAITSKEGPVSHEMHRAGVHCIGLNTLGMPRIMSLFTSIRLWFVFVKYRVAVVHVQHAFLLRRCYRAARLAGVRIVLTEHTDADFKRRKKWTKEIAKYCRRADKISVVHSELKNYMVTEMGIESSLISVISNGVDTDKFAPVQDSEEKARLRAQLGLPVSGLIFGWVGRMHPDKEVITLLRAFQTLPNSNDNHLVLVGDGLERDELESYCKAKRLQNVHFMGMRDDPENFMKCFDLFVMSSKTEGLPIVMLEAMSSGLPAVSTDVGGISELLSQEYGEIVDVGSWSQLGEAMRSMACKGRLEPALGNRARERILQEYSLDQLVDNFDHLLFEDR